MITRLRADLSVLTLALAAAACDPIDGDPIDGDEDAGEIAFRPGNGGIVYDSAFIGGHDFSELDLRRFPYRGTRLRAVCLRPALLSRCLTRLTVINGLLVGKDDNGTYTGGDLVDSRWTFDFDTTDPETGKGDGVLDSSATVRLTSRSMVQVPGGGALELVDLRVDRASVTGPLKSRLPAGSEPLPVCAPDPSRGGATQAALLGDVSVDSDDRSFSPRSDTLHIACTSAAIGHGTVLGYRPEGIGLDGFAGMIRAVAGDYCGTGESFAAPADPVALADVWAIQGTLAPVREARWSSAGALCLDNARHPGVDAAAIRGACGIPKCSNGPLGAAGEVAVSSLPQ